MQQMLQGQASNVAEMQFSGDSYRLFFMLTFFYFLTCCISIQKMLLKLPRIIFVYSISVTFLTYFRRERDALRGKLLAAQSDFTRMQADHDQVQVYAMHLNIT